MSLLKVEEFILFLFSTTQNVMSAEKLLLEAAVPCMVMPLPAALSASCGLAIRIYPNDQQQAAALFNEAEIQPAAVYRGKKAANHIEYQELA